MTTRIPDAKLKTQFGLIRHAETRWNREKRIQGQHDSPLTAKGRQQAEHWGHVLQSFSWQKILSSDLPRAKETAALINQTLRIDHSWDAGLREQDWGAWVGKTLRQIQRENARELACQEAAGWNFRPPQGEYRRQVWQRSRQTLLHAADQWPGQRILVVAHEGVLKCLLFKLMQNTSLSWDVAHPRPYYLHWLLYDGSGLRLESVNALDLEASVQVTENPRTP